MMKGLAFFLIIVFSIIACSCPDEDLNENSYMAYLYIDGSTTYQSLGYTHVIIDEYNRTLDHNMTSNLLRLSFALNKPTSTFILEGDTISDTIRFVYNVTPYLHDNFCGYQLELSTPEVVYHTFSGYQISYYDSTEYILHIKVNL